MISPVRRLTMLCDGAAPSVVLTLSLHAFCPIAAASAVDPDGGSQLLPESDTSLVLAPSLALSTNEPVPDTDSQGEPHSPALFRYLLHQSTPAMADAPASFPSSASTSLHDSKGQTPPSWTLRLTKARLYRLDARQSAPLAPNADRENDSSAEARVQNTHLRISGFGDEFGIEDLANLPTGDRSFESVPPFQLINNPTLSLRAPVVDLYQSPRPTDHGLTPLTPGTSIWKLPLSDTLSLDGRGWHRQIDQDISVLVVGAEAKVGLSERVDLRMGYELLRSESDSVGLTTEGEGVYAQFRFRF
jgi:hypothetical protein